MLGRPRRWSWPVADFTRLIGDIGGTSARFAFAAAGDDFYHGEMTLSCGDFATPGEAIARFLELRQAPAPRFICLAAAGPLVGERIAVTNSSWRLAAGELAQEFGARDVRLLNDFEAIACGLPLVNRRFTTILGAVAERELGDGDFRICVIGPGTGLGAAGLVRQRGIEFPLTTEAGHVGFAAESEVQVELLRFLRASHERVSDERLVSGMGVENLFVALGAVTGREAAPRRSAEIFQLAREGDALARDAVDLFFEVLGQVAGNLVLAQGAYDGVYVAGGIAQRHADLLLTSRFRRGFENKGRHRALLEPVPTLLITHRQPGLLGAARRALQMGAAVA